MGKRKTRSNLTAAPGFVPRAPRGSLGDIYVLTPAGTFPVRSRRLAAPVRIHSATGSHNLTLSQSSDGRRGNRTRDRATPRAAHAREHEAPTLMRRAAASYR